jgi:hypothetical protein
MKYILIPVIKLIVALFYIGYYLICCFFIVIINALSLIYHLDLSHFIWIDFFYDCEFIVSQTRIKDHEDKIGQAYYDVIYYKNPLHMIMNKKSKEERVLLKCLNP